MTNQLAELERHQKIPKLIETIVIIFNETLGRGASFDRLDRFINGNLEINRVYPEFGNRRLIDVAAILGRIDLIIHLIERHRASVGSVLDKPFTNLFYSICCCPFPSYRENMLAWLLEKNYFLQLNCGITRKHIAAVRLETTAEQRYVATDTADNLGLTPSHYFHLVFGSDSERLNLTVQSGYYRGVNMSVVKLAMNIHTEVCLEHQHIIKSGRYFDTAGWLLANYCLWDQFAVYALFQVETLDLLVAPSAKAPLLFILIFHQQWGVLTQLLKQQQLMVNLSKPVPLEREGDVIVRSGIEIICQSEMPVDLLLKLKLNFSDNILCFANYCCLIVQQDQVHELTELFSYFDQYNDQEIDRLCNACDSCLQENTQDKSVRHLSQYLELYLLLKIMPIASSDWIERVDEQTLVQLYIIPAYSLLQGLANLVQKTCDNAIKSVALLKIGMQLLEIKSNGRLLKIFFGRYPKALDELTLGLSWTQADSLIGKLSHIAFVCLNHSNAAAAKELRGCVVTDLLRQQYRLSSMLVALGSPLQAGAAEVASVGNDAADDTVTTPTL